MVVAMRATEMSVVRMLRTVVTTMTALELSPLTLAGKDAKVALHRSGVLYYNDDCDILEALVAMAMTPASTTATVMTIKMVMAMQGWWWR